MNHTDPDSPEFQLRQKELIKDIAAADISSSSYSSLVEKYNDVALWTLPYPGGFFHPLETLAKKCLPGHRLDNPKSLAHHASLAVFLDSNEHLLVDTPKNREKYMQAHNELSEKIKGTDFLKIIISKFSQTASHEDMCRLLGIAIRNYKREELVESFSSILEIPAISESPQLRPHKLMFCLWSSTVSAIKPWEQRNSDYIARNCSFIADFVKQAIAASTGSQPDEKSAEQPGNVHIEGPHTGGSCAESKEPVRSKATVRQETRNLLAEHNLHPATFLSPDEEYIPQIHKQIWKLFEPDFNSAEFMKGLFSAKSLMVMEALGNLYDKGALSFEELEYTISVGLVGVIRIMSPTFSFPNFQALESSVLRTYEILEANDSYIHEAVRRSSSPEIFRQYIYELTGLSQSSSMIGCRENASMEFLESVFYRHSQARKNFDSAISEIYAKHCEILSLKGLVDTKIPARKNAEKKPGI